MRFKTSERYRQHQRLVGSCYGGPLKQQRILKNVFVLVLGTQAQKFDLRWPFMASRMRPLIYGALLSAGLACVALLLVLSSPSNNISRKVLRHVLLE
jgi:hypothetical protein